MARKTLPKKADIDQQTLTQMARRSRQPNRDPDFVYEDQTENQREINELKSPNDCQDSDEEDDLFQMDMQALDDAAAFQESIFAASERADRDNCSLEQDFVEVAQEREAKRARLQAEAEERRQLREAERRARQQEREQEKIRREQERISKRERREREIRQAKEHREYLKQQRQLQKDYERSEREKRRLSKEKEVQQKKEQRRLEKEEKDKKKNHMKELKARARRGLIHPPHHKASHR
ncbi:hypothetical protein AKO1_013710 [Acrasis kona]|uniref:Uncharacterized protein n=1 Tax=Acrasis kona TaxID=1008807 RepID=A0AAW2ZIA9_9EUKA